VRHTRVAHHCLNLPLSSSLSSSSFAVNKSEIPPGEDEGGTAVLAKVRRRMSESEYYVSSNDLHHKTKLS